MMQFLLVILSHALIVPSLAAQPSRPNVLFILTDDQGTLDLNCYGSKDLVTPNLDALASRGVRFTQFYAAAPVCSPSRAAILTGRYPQRAGLHGNAPSQPNVAGGLPPEQLTLAELLKSNGYVTGLVGKWHLGYSEAQRPNAQGFDHAFGHLGGCIDNYSHFYYWSGPNRHDLFRNGAEVHQDGSYFPDVLAAEAKSFLTANKEKPFFLYFALNTPHYPMQPRAKWREHYRDLPEQRRHYAALVSTTDEVIGEVLAHLDALNLRENTLVIYMSDHGHSTEERAFFGGGNAGPYRGAKFSLFEGGIRVPAIVSLPARLPTNQVRDQFAAACDWFPTIAELTGTKLPENHKIDGRSLLPILNSPDAPSAHDAFHWATGQRQWAVRQGDWKLIGNPLDSSRLNARETPGVHLSNLKDDPGERTNYADRHPDVVKRLSALHEAWVEEVPVPRR